MWWPWPVGPGRSVQTGGSRQCRAGEVGTEHVEHLGGCGSAYQQCLADKTAYETLEDNSPLSPEEVVEEEGAVIGAGAAKWSAGLRAGGAPVPLLGELNVKLKQTPRWSGRTGLSQGSPSPLHPCIGVVPPGCSTHSSGRWPPRSRRHCPSPSLVLMRSASFVISVS